MPLHLTGFAGPLWCGGAQADWLRYRESFRQQWVKTLDQNLDQARQWVHDICVQVANNQDGWRLLEKVSLDEKRQILQALNSDPSLGGACRSKLERVIREEIKRYKVIKKKPMGDFVKLLITHKGWNAAEIRRIIREPAVCKLHPDPTEAERIWVCCAPPNWELAIELHGNGG